MFGFFKKETPVEPKEIHTIEVPVPCTCKDDLQKLVADQARLTAENARLEDQRLKAVKDLKETKQDHKIVVEDIKHMQRMLDEKNQLELEKKIFEAEKEANKEIDGIRKTYASKLENELLEERKKMQSFMEKVMAALPNVNVQLGQKDKE